MYQYKGLDDTITAIASAMGQGSIGIVRISGEQAISILGNIFKPRSQLNVETIKSHTLHYGWIIDNDIIDEVLVSVMRSPKSYTCEDVVEISCHGGIVPLKAILNVILKKGARLAEPGEFTKRAFLNGRIDLAQAEAVLDIIQSKTESFLRVSHHQLRGDLSQALKLIREKLMLIYTEIEAVLNFPEDDIDAAGKKQVLDKIADAADHVHQLLKSSEHGRILKEGMKIVLFGKPNVGKSSLLNVLLKHQRAIVSEVEGTTRDTIEESAQINGIPLQIVDTAGILDPRNNIEEQAVQRSHQHVEDADLILFMVDGSSELTQQDDKLIQLVKKMNVMLIINKSDCDQKIDLTKLEKHFQKNRMIHISALTKQGIDVLEKGIVEFVWHDQVVDTHGILLSNLRHIESLKSCEQHLIQSSAEINKGTGFEFISEEIKCAVNELDLITGKNIDADLLDTIFSQFCIGK